MGNAIHSKKGLQLVEEARSVAMRRADALLNDAKRVRRLWS